MREWLIVISVLLIAGILLDGLRRVRAARRQSIKMSRQVAALDAAAEVDAEPPGSSEFPSGGARVAAYRDDNDAEHILQNVRQKHVESKKTRGVRARENDDTKAPPVDHLPNLMNAFVKRTQPPEHKEPELGAIANLKDLDDQLEKLVPELKQTGPTPKAPPTPAQTSLFTAKQDAAVAAAPAKPAVAPPQEVLVMHIVAQKGLFFSGDDLLPLLMDLQMRFGDMDIFHRHQDDDGTGPVLFSLANMVKPGTFELSGMADFETPGLSLFMTLPAADDAMHAFALMAQAAKRLTKELGGELKDESRNNMTQQIFEHYKERVTEFERKRLLANA
jgi:cell division protein ZipA